MRHSPPARKPTFLWQAVLILLPVAVLTVMGLISLRQDRLLAEQQAREFGAASARRLARAIGEETVTEFQAYRIALGDLHAIWAASLVGTNWPGTPEAAKTAWQQIHSWQQANPAVDLSVQPDVEVLANLSGSDWGLKAGKPAWERIQAWQLEFPGYDLSAMPGLNPLLEDGSPFQFYPVSPAPPSWLLELSATQQTVWQDFEHADYTFNQPNAALAAIAKFLATQPGSEAMANAEFHQLLLQSRELPAGQAITNLAQSRWAISGNLDEAGMPIGQLICFDALRLLPEHSGEPDRLAVDIVRSIENRPSILSPRLIAEAERVTRPRAVDARLGTNILRLWWNTSDQTAQIVRDFLDRLPLEPKDSPWVWISGKSGRIMIIHDDAKPAPDGSANGHLLVIPETVVDRSLAAAVARSDAALPAYALAELDFCGKTLFWRMNNSLITTNATALPVLGEAAGTLASLPIDTVAPQFQVKVLLADRDGFYARQHERTLWFGGLILTSTLAALLGLAAAGRAFRRQLELNDLKSNFVSSVSHELRAPIASVRLMAENLERGKIPAAEKQQDYFRFIVQECQRLSSLIENVLDFSRIEQGRKEYEFEPTDLTALTRTTVLLMEPYAQEKGVELQMAGSPAATVRIELNLDGRAIQQAVVNLVDNAIKHSARGEMVIIGLERKNPAVVHLWVADHGPGIPAAEREKIFERFYRRGSELRRETQGIGIGLSLVKHIVEAHGGRAVVEGEVGRGSRFILELPASEKTESGKAEKRKR